MRPNHRRELTARHLACVFEVVLFKLCCLDMSCGPWGAIPPIFLPAFGRASSQDFVQKDSLVLVTTLSRGLPVTIVAIPYPSHISIDHMLYYISYISYIIIIMLSYAKPVLFRMGYSDT